MFDIWETVSALRQPCLSRPMPDAFLGADGAVRPSVLKSLDALLWEHILSGYAEWVAPKHDMIALCANQKWLNISALQKAIRRGQVERAVQYAKQGCQVDADQVFRRLAVCALEDVGIGNLLAVAESLAVLGDRKRRREASELYLAAYLAQRLAESPKSRLACDLLSLVEYNPNLEPLIADWANAPDHNLAKRAGDEAKSIEQKMLATWLLAGTHRFQSSVLPKSNYRNRVTLMEIMAQSRMPLMLYFIADRGAARTSDALFVSYLQIWKLLQDIPDLDLVEIKIPSSPMIGNFPAEAYDMHTREGKAAIRAGAINFMKTPTGHPLKIEVFQNAIFRVEGGLLSREIVSNKIISISEASKCFELESVNELDANRLCAQAIKCLPQIHLIRGTYSR